MPDVGTFFIAFGVMLLCYIAIFILSATSVIDLTNKKVIAKCRKNGSYTQAYMYKDKFYTDDNPTHTYWIMHYKYVVDGVEYTKRVKNHILQNANCTFYYNPKNPKKVYNLSDGRRGLKIILTLAPIAIFFGILLIFL